MDSLIRWHEDRASCTIGTHHYLYGGRGSLGVAPIMGFYLSGSVTLLGAPLFEGCLSNRGFSPFCGPERGLRNRERIGTLDSGGIVPLLSDLGTIGTHSTRTLSSVIISPLQLL